MTTQKFSIGTIVVTTKLGYTNSQGTIVDYNAETKRYRVLWHNDNMRTWVSCSVLTDNLNFEKSQGTGKTKSRFCPMKKMQLEIEKLQKKVTAGKKALDKRRKNWEKDLQEAFINATTVWKMTWGETSELEIRNQLDTQLTKEFQYDYKNWEELADKLGKLNWEFSQKYEMKQY
jgi:hypothetical protein